MARALDDERRRPRLPALLPLRPAGAQRRPADRAGGPSRPVRDPRQALRLAAGARQVADPGRRLLPLPRRHGDQRPPLGGDLPGRLPRPRPRRAHPLRRPPPAGRLRARGRCGGEGPAQGLPDRRHPVHPGPGGAALRAAAAGDQPLLPGSWHRHRDGDRGDGLHRRGDPRHHRPHPREPGGVPARPLRRPAARSGAALQGGHVRSATMGGAGSAPRPSRRGPAPTARPSGSLPAGPTRRSTSTSSRWPSAACRCPPAR